MTQKLVNFGSIKVPKPEKVQKVRSLFNDVSNRYRVMNDLMSFGTHRAWRRRLMHIISPKPNKHLLDIAGGDGDLSIRFLKKGGGKATVLDVSEQMLEVAKSLAIDNGITSEISFIQGNGEKLSFTSNSFDVAVNGFGLRNMTDPSAAIKEAYRVLKPFSYFYVMEFVPPKDKFSKLWLEFLPTIGSLVANNANAYRYLSDSILGFLNHDEVIEIYKKAGFKSCNVRLLAMDNVAIYSGIKID